MAIRVVAWSSKWRV